ncbi:unnamed protein product [Paramecium pentaurelia]|uniref:Uncharacterized protein n=1 Tax=Paramecium pentaurelia TaxID=43138 RepID=A0A8S1Y0R4_9CILI|nr:unnamed protein product [Paramecium pentaurelia]
MKWFWINQLQNNSQSSNRELKAQGKCLQYHNSCVTYGKNACQEYPPTKTTLQSGNVFECILIKNRQ